MKYLVILMTACLLIGSCKKQPSIPQPAQVDVYVAGYERNENGKLVATVWKNGMAQSLTDGNHDAIAKSVFVSENNNVYAAGYEKNAGNIEVATVWKNGSLLYTLGDGADFSMANSICIYSGSVYVAGVKHNGSKDVAMVWRDNDPWELTNGDNNAWAHSVSVTAGEMRVGGYESNGTKNVASYWKNETPDEFVIWATTPNSSINNTHHLTGGTSDALASSAFIQWNTDPAVMYYAGSETNANNKMVAKVWKPGGPQSLTDGTNDATVTALFVTESDLYATGYEMTADFKFMPKLWKNGDFTNLANGSNNAAAYSLKVLGEDVYIVGTEFTGGGNTAAILWTNGQPASLSTIGAGALSVFVAEKP